MISYPDLNPIAFTIPQLQVVSLSVGPVPVHWYGLAYLAGFLLGLWWFKRLCARYSAPGLSPTVAEDLLTWIFVGVLLGGRVGYTLFYNFPYYSQNVTEIFAVWQGGMSFHGGFLGVLLASLLFAYKRNINWFDITDRLAPSACFGLFFGRLANFVNAELVGRPTHAPWGMVFPNAGAVPRHPSQLYEATLEGVVLFALLWLVVRQNGVRRFQLSGAFLLGYGTFRSLVEFTREPDPFPHLTGGVFQWLSMGQLLSLPMVALGLYLLVKSGQVACKKS